jgi:translation elongation factor EF-4
MQKHQRPIWLKVLKMLNQWYLLIYPVDTEDYEDLNSMEKLQLNDASLVFYQKVLLLLDLFPLWILGMHMEIIQERLEWEFNMTVITILFCLHQKKILKLP